MNKKHRFAQLLQLYLSGNISADEHAELFDLLSSNDHDEFLGKAIYKDFHRESSSSRADLPPHVAEEMVRYIFNSEKNTSKILPLKTKNRFSKWMVAASILTLAGLAAFFLYLNGRTDKRQSFRAFIPPQAKVRTSNADATQLIVLEDGTKVSLMPNSKLYYAPVFAADKREVVLEGEAFFEVAKNPARPFLVYYNNIVTRVLGTSFRINTDSKTGNVEVAVFTGKVQVYENNKSGSDKANKSIILTPNQKVVYKPEDRLFETVLVDKPEQVNKEELEKKAFSFVYEEEKLQNVFQQLESSYQIEIVVENSNINECEFTGDVSKQDLYTKLKIICLATNASYEINGTKILIKGNGCTASTN
jgi:hypothetical protein